MNDHLNAIVLAIVEGLTEFLPISSTGHLIIVEDLLGVHSDAPQWRVFRFVSQFGAIAAVVVYFWRDLWRRLKTLFSADWRTHLFLKVGVAFVPSVVFGLLLNDYMELYLENNPVAVAGALIVGAGIIEFIDRRYRRAAPQTLDDVSYRHAIIIGLAQCISMWPGVSRAGATIMSGMAAGLTPRVATEFSFYLAIPTMVAAGGYRLLKYHEDLSSGGAGVIMVGTAVAFLVAWIVVAAFLQYVRRYRFTPFAIYRVVLGVAVLAYNWPTIRKLLL